MEICYLKYNNRRTSLGDERSSFCGTLFLNGKTTNGGATGRFEGSINN